MLRNKSLSCDLLSVYLAISVTKKFTSGSAAVLFFLLCARLFLDLFDMCYKAFFSFLQT